MFEVEIKDCGGEKNFANERLSLIRKVIESIAEIVDQMEIKCSDAGLTIQVMDSMHVAFADIFFSRDMFSSYRCDRDVQLGIPLKHLLVIFKGLIIEEQSFVRFTCDDNPQTLKIQHVLPNSRYEFDITLYQIGADNYDVPELDYDASVRMPSDQFRNISRLIGSFGEYIVFECEQKMFHFKQTSDLARNTMCLKSNDESVLIDCKKAVRLEIAMKYVNLINKLSVLTNEITLNLGDAAPVFFEIKLKEIGHIKFYVAPKAEN